MSDITLKWNDIRTSLDMNELSAIGYKEVIIK
jgi:hypothetical protein